MNKQQIYLELKQKRWVKVLTHLLVWALLFSLPYLLSSGQPQNRFNVLFHAWIPLLLSAFLFYLNYLVLIERFFFRDKVVLYFFLNVVAMILVIFTIQEIKELYSHFLTFPTPPQGGPPKRFFIYRDIISSIIPIIFAFGFKLSEQWFKSETERKAIENNRLQAELQQLKYQLQPHFFFNSLNNIYFMVDSEPNKAKQTIHTLSKLIRYFFNEADNNRVPLETELAFMTQYIEIMKLRFSDKTKVDYHFPEVSPQVMVPPLLFISLIENAFKHGVSASQESEIRFEMDFTNDVIHFKSSNPNYAKTGNDMSGSGIGLNNLKKQLNLLFPDKHTFETTSKEGQFFVILTIHI